MIVPGATMILFIMGSCFCLLEILFVWSELHLMTFSVLLSCSIIEFVIMEDYQSLFAIFAGVPYSEHSSFTELREFVQV